MEIEGFHMARGAKKLDRKKLFLKQMCQLVGGPHTIMEREKE
jgi:hypothetical protein